jgi:hypothetical protein
VAGPAEAVTGAEELEEEEEESCVTAGGAAGISDLTAGFTFPVETTFIDSFTWDLLSTMHVYRSQM